MIEALLELAPLLILLLVGILDIRQRRENRRRYEAAEQRRALADRKAERLADGLPPHERCLCAECRAWRTNPRNAELLRLRGLQ